MSEIKKFGFVQKSASESDMGKINAQSLKELSPEEVFTFRVAAADDQVDRDYERFVPDALDQLSKLFVGRTIIMDHDWSSSNQTARIYDATIEHGLNGVTRLCLSAYMVRSEATESVIRSIEGGILKEVSVGCAVKKAICSICGTDKTKQRCYHRPGQVYDNIQCVVSLEDVEDAYECSFVAVPSQRNAGVIKSYGGENGQEVDDDIKTALALVELESINI